jgi:hypothetical protein
VLLLQSSTHKNRSISFERGVELQLAQYQNILHRDNRYTSIEVIDYTRLGRKNKQTKYRSNLF